MVILGSLALILLLSGSQAIAEPEIRFVRVEGPFVRVSAEQLRTRVAEVADRGYFAVDLDQVQSALQEMPWVKAAEVTREWPETLRVKVVEFEPMAHWNDTQLIDRSGQLFSVELSAPIMGLPQLAGPEGALEAVSETYRQLDTSLSAVGEELTALRLNQRGSWNAKLTSGTELRLGSRDLKLRINRYIKAHDHIGVQPLYVDLRYPNGLAVRPSSTEGGQNDAS